MSRRRRAAPSIGWCRSLNEASVLERPRRRGRWPIAAAILAVFALVVAALLLRPSGEPTGAAAAFRYIFASGERRSYDLDMQITFTPRDDATTQGFEGRVSATLDIAAVERRPDGSTVLDLSVREVSTSPGRTNLPTEGGRLRLTIAEDGRVLDAEGTGGLFSIAGVDPGALLGGSGSGDSAGSQLLFPQLPSEAIEPGDEWSRTSSIPIPFGDERLDVRLKGLFEGYEDTEHGRAARIRLDVDTPIDYRVTIAELTKAAREAVPSSPQPTPPEGQIELDGNTKTESRALLLPSTNELIRLEGTTKMSVEMNVSGAQVRGIARAYAFDAIIEMDIVRRED